MPDPYLTAIVESVEEGGDPVRISAALHSGAVVSGFVRRSQFFVSITKDVTLTTLKAVESRQPRLPSLPALRLQQEPHRQHLLRHRQGRHA